MQMTDHTLHSRWIHGRDAQAFKALTTKYCAMVHGTCLRILRNTSDAEDITQECFLALASADRSPEGSMGAWLHRIATYRALNRRRNDQRRREREALYTSGRDAATEAAWDDIDQYIDQCIEALPEQVRNTIVAHFFDHESVTEIAARESVTHSAISQRIKKGVDLIRGRMKQNGFPVGGAALTAFLSLEASAWPNVPAHLTDRLSRLALSGAPKAGVAATGATFGGKALIGTAAALVIAVAAVLFATPRSSQAGTEALSAPEVTTVIAEAELAVPTAEPTIVQPNEPELSAPQMQKQTAVVEALVNAATELEDMEPTTWQGVLHEYTEHQNRIRRIRFDYEHEAEGDYYWYNYEPAPRGHREFFRSGTLITDGDRVRLSQLTWGHDFGNGVLPKSRAWQGHWVFDGDTYAEINGLFQMHPNARTSMIVNSAFRDGRSYLLFSRYPGAPISGMPLDQGWRLEELIRGAHSVKLLPRREYVGTGECFVIEADTAYGDIKAWFDPKKNYNAAKTTITLEGGDIYENSPMLPDTSAYYECIVDRFEQVDGLWVPAEAHLRQQANLRGGNGHDYFHHHTRSNIDLLAPGEDDPLYVIYSDEIPNGTTYLETGTIRRKGDPEWQWQDDQFVLVYPQTGKRAEQPRDGIGFGGGIIADTEN